MSNETTDTPRTDAVPPELDSITNDHVIRALRLFCREKISKDGSLESWINLGADRFEKAEAEVERLRANLKRTIEIAERLRSKIFTDGWFDEDDELDQLKANLNPAQK